MLSFLVLLMEVFKFKNVWPCLNTKVTICRFFLQYNCQFNKEDFQSKRYAAPRAGGHFHCVNVNPTSLYAVVCNDTCRLPHARKVKSFVKAVFMEKRFKPRHGRVVKVKVPVACECLWRKDRRRQRKQ